QCMGNAVNFSNTGTVVGVTWAWNFGVGAVPAISAAQNPANIVYGSAGIKSVALTTTNIATGCNVTTAQNIVIDPIPVASFTSNAPQCTGSSVNFSNTGTAVGVVYSWSFGAGATPATSSAQNPFGVIYSTSGAKTVTLTTTNPNTGCFASSTQVITINAAPVASFTSNAPVCTGANVNFTNTGTSGAGITYAWNFGAGAVPATSVLQNPAGVVYSTSGIKTVTLTTTNSVTGCSSIATQTILINQTPTATFTSTAPQCEGNTVDFTNTGTSGPGVTYNWNFGIDANPSGSTAESPTGIIYTNAGNELITFSVNNGSCTAVDTMSIGILSAPDASFTSNAPQCTGSSVNFTYTGVSVGPNFTYSWNFGLGAVPATSVAQNPAGVMYSVSGNAMVTLTVTNTVTGCTTTSTQNLNINQAPTATFNSNAPVCEGVNVNFTNTGTTGVGITYNWNFGVNGNPVNSVAQNATDILFTASGAQTVMFSITSLTTGCSATATQSITINSAPVATFTSNTPTCAGNAINFTNTGSSGAGVTYSWDFGLNSNPNSSTAESPMGIMYTTGGKKLITYTVNNGLCTAVDTMTIAIDSLPMLMAGTDTTICAGDSVQIGSAPIAGYKYKWFPSSQVSNDTIANPEAKPFGGTTMYIVTATTPTGCTSTDTVMVNMLAPLIADAGEAAAFCKGDSAQIGAPVIGGQKYSWSPSAGLSDTAAAQPYAKPASTTVYTLSVTGAGCPKVTGMVQVTVHTGPAWVPMQFDTVGMGTAVQLNVNGGVEYSWSPAAGLNNPSIFDPLAGPDSSTTYVVTITDLFGCMSMDSIRVTVISNNFWAPTAFTPNGDGKDDIFYIHGSGVTNFSMGVYNRWGEQIFYSEDIMQGWDGRRQVTGQEMPNGAYVYYVKGTDAKGNSVNTKGLINLIR